MKFLIIVVCIAIVTAEDFDEIKERFTKALAECKETVGASDADVDQYNHRRVPESTAGKCMIACVNKKNKIQDANGKIFAESAKEAAHTILQNLESANEDLYKKLLKIYLTCIDEADNGPDECEVAAHYFICFSKGLEDAKFPMILTEE